MIRSLSRHLFSAALFRRWTRGRNRPYTVLCLSALTGIGYPYCPEKDVNAPMRFPLAEPIRAKRLFHTRIDNLTSILSGALTMW
jgi:hypothetical protein